VERGADVDRPNIRVIEPSVEIAPKDDMGRSRGQGRDPLRQGREKTIVTLRVGRGINRHKSGDFVIQGNVSCHCSSVKNRSGHWQMGVEDNQSLGQEQACAPFTFAVMHGLGVAIECITWEQLFGNKIGFEMGFGHPQSINVVGTHPVIKVGVGSKEVSWQLLLVEGQGD